jgi:hypothetical protein
MVEATLGDTQMVLVTLSPDGPLDGVPQWSVLSGQGTLLSDPSHPLWDTTKPEGYQSFLVSDTLPVGEEGPVDTIYRVEADADLGTGVQHVSEEITLHVVNFASALGLAFGVPQAKP